MKKWLEVLSFVLVITLFCVIFSLASSARDLEPCRLCGGKGNYHCVSCENTGAVTSGGCGGTGKWTCPGEDGRSDSDTDKILNDIAEKNDFESLEDGKLFPLYFEGHQEVGFPVCVTLGIDKGVLAGGSDIFVYHISNDGTIEPLGKAEYGTYEDGTVKSLSFIPLLFQHFLPPQKSLI